MIVPPLGSAVPRWGNPLTRGIGRLALRLMGWRVVGDVPNVPKLVAIAAPHTCSLDVVVGLVVLLALGARVHWLAKHTSFYWPLGPVLRWSGAVPVNRSAAGSVVRSALERMKAEEQFYLALAPEGTRKRVAEWKTGFYRIALAAGVPIVPVALDYPAREARIGPPLTPTGNYEADLAVLKAHFRAEMARHPERF